MEDTLRKRRERRGRGGEGERGRRGEGAALRLKISCEEQIEGGAYTDDKCTDEGSWQPQLVPVGHETATNNGRCVASKSEL